MDSVVYRENEAYHQRHYQGEGCIEYELVGTHNDEHEDYQEFKQRLHNADIGIERHPFVRHYQ